MSDELKLFLVDKCKFKDKNLESVLQKLDEQGITEVDQLTMCTQEDLISFELTKFQAIAIVKQLASLQQITPQPETQSEPLKPQPLAEPHREPETGKVVPIHEKYEELKGEFDAREVYDDNSEEQSHTEEMKSHEYLKQPYHEVKEESKQDAEMIDTSLKSKLRNEDKFKGKKGPSSVVSGDLIKKDSFLLFESYEDTSSEYKMSKIRLVEREYWSLFQDIKDYELQAIGLYGNFNGCLNMAAVFLDQNLEGNFLFNEGLLVLRNQNKLVFIFKTREDLYDFKHGTDSTHLATTYLRYLVDVCQNIYIVPSEDFVMNPDLKNPYQDFVNPGFQLQEMIIKPDDKVSVKEVVMADEKIKIIDFAAYQQSFDNQKYIMKVDFDRKVQYENIKYSFYRRDLYANESNHYNSIQKACDYSEIKDILLENWSKNHQFFYEQHHPRKFENKVLSIVGEFIKAEHKEAFFMAVRELQDEFQGRSNELKVELQEEYDKELELLNLSFFEALEKLQCDYYRSILKELEEEIGEQPQGYWEKLKGIFKTNPKEEAACTGRCNKISFNTVVYNQKYNYKDIKWDFLQKQFESTYSSVFIYIHKNQQDSFDKLLRELNKESKECLFKYTHDKQARFSSLREYIIRQLFERCQPFINNKRENVSNSINIQFQAINVLRDSGHQIQNWNINKFSIPLHHTFGKDTQGMVHLRQLLFVTDTAGLVLFANTPEGKSSIFYFNIGSKTQVIFSHMLTLASNESNLSIEPNLKQWFIYDNKERRSNIGKLTSQGKIEDGVPTTLYGQICDGVKVDQIISACFLPYGDKIYILNQSNHLFEYKWQSRQLNLVCKKINKDGAGVVKEMIRPADPEDTYDEVQASSDGKNIILKSRGSIDIYDLNLDRTFTFPLSSDFLYFKAFSDKISNFIITFGRKETKCYQLVGLTATKTLKSEILGRKQANSLGNPILDYLYQAFRKFGPHSEFIGSPAYTQLHFICKSAAFNQANFRKYFQGLSFQSVNLQVINKTVDQVQKGDLCSDGDSVIQTQKLKMILLGRIALHIATIENFTLVPLQNGVNISDQIAENLIQNRERTSDLIERIIDMIKFGIYEKILDNIRDQVYVVSVVGRQSSGKSYVMNRLFGTRFNVAATRCTDGIWMSIVEVYSGDASKIFVVLDCEGLFSARRNEQEEMKLCLALSAISDVMILNQDLSFNRYLNTLFNNFTKSIGRIKGKKLFKGCLMMLVRDVKSEEAEQAYKELQSNFIQLQSSKQDGFLSAVFQGNLKSQCLNYFQQPIFNSEIEMVRDQYFLSLDQKRWTNGRDLLESFKITLAQIFLDDDTDMDIHKLKISCENLYLTALQMFFNGGDKFNSGDGKDGKYCQKFAIKETEYDVSINQSDIKLRQDLSEFEDDNDKSSLTEEIITQFVSQTIDYTLSIHNDWMKSFTTYITELLEHRKTFILNYFQQSLPEDLEFYEIIKSYEYKLRTIFESYIPKVRYCDKTCRNCLRLCSLKLNHKNNCNCETQHICQEICNKTEECEQSKYLCIEVFGHTTEHRCGEGNHKCSSYCAVAECAYFCQYEGGHDDSQSHDCGNKHPCKEKCQDSFCTRTCQFDATFEHDAHICGEDKCIHKCALCDKQCVFPNHLHQQAIEDNERDKLKYETDGKVLSLNYHICGNEHLCKEVCEEKGVCQVDYKIEEKLWKNEFGEFTYPYFKPLENRNECKMMIPPFSKDHEEPHDCKVGEHRCYHQCPECKSFCNKAVDHDDMHSTNAHRNKENSVFVSNKGKSKVSFMAEGKKREYKIGESCQPENCTMACGRKGRAHYHLKECKDEEKCEAKVNPFVKHSTDKYHPFEDKVFDMWLCVNYWNSMNWKPPIDGAQMEEIQSCNYICCHHSHGDTLKYCNGTAWHTDAHNFDCEHGGSFSTNVIDVVFCCDTTGSMSSYIDKSKTTVKKIINDLKTISKDSERSCKFAFVAYRDHPPQDSSYVTRSKDLSDEPTIISFIDTVTADGGGDGPESVLDGLYDSINKITWRKDSMRYLFHIADAPPHGREYTGGSGDGFPEGCPCGIKIETLAAQLKENQIRYKLLKIGSYPNTMASVFKKNIEDYEENDLDSAVQLEIKVSEILIRDIKSEEQDVLLH